MTCRGFESSKDPLTEVKPGPTTVSLADLKKMGIKDLTIKDQPASQPARKR
jgi:hypothetical protein